MRKMSLSVLMKVSILAAMAALLQYIEIPLTMFFPDFLKIDISDVPALIGGFAFGPIAGILVVLVKNIVHGLTAGHTLWVGEFANFIVGASLVGVASLIYKRNRTMKGAIIGLVTGTLFMAFVGGLTNYYILLPLYSKVMGWDMDAFVQVGSAVNPLIKNFWGYILLAIVPFNILKGIVASFVTVLVYKPIAVFLRREASKAVQI
ncbi:ECF transporter S component [Oceanirhabdus sp. W0125-5]|uniref:ECF transporter S component n=1 Tax=Oceanirhabdus sp. W0125-5 TaxID=2999116 RepID=UPI0022F2D4FE|nr:ECF transporter S component [Oceanirhabdus sp. W0125-5]WBW98512.1 ECF transporter S component [Oceanirhabdus sp. W0125-5]